MALKKEKIFLDQFGDGRVFPNTYIRVDKIYGSKELLVIHVGYYNEDRNPMRYLMTEQFNFVPDLNEVNFIAQAYNYLKTLPQFSNSVDC